MKIFGGISGSLSTGLRGAKGLKVLQEYLGLETPHAGARRGLSGAAGVVAPRRITSPPRSKLSETL